MGSKNPLEKICGDLHELLVQHFDKSDVLKVSEVSSEWNEAVSKSSKCMAQIHLSIDLLVAVPEVIIKSNRQYNDLKICIDTKYPDENNQRAIQLLQKLSPFLKKLEIDSNTFIDFGPKLQYPKLESLNIKAAGLVGLVNVKKLKKLMLSVRNYDRETIDLIGSQENLKELELSGVCEPFFRFDPKAPSGIERFTFSYFGGISEVTSAKFNNFLESMSESLTHLELRSQIIAENLELIVNKMPKLKSLELIRSQDCLNEIKLKSNTSITKLKIKNPATDAHFLLLSLVNLEELNIDRVFRFSHFEWIARNLLKLKKVSFRSFSSPRLWEVAKYNVLKRYEEGMNMDIEIFESE
jgi:hypothetical protein